MKETGPIIIGDGQNTALAVLVARRLAPAGGRYLVRTNAIDQIEGEGMPPKAFLIIAFHFAGLRRTSRVLREPLNEALAAFLERGTGTPLPISRHSAASCSGGCSHNQRQTTTIGPSVRA